MQIDNKVSIEAKKVQYLANKLEDDQNPKMEDKVKKTPASVTKYSSARKG